jgi:hypothetical protein
VDPTCNAHCHRLNAQNKIKVKGRAGMSVRMLDHHMRVYILARTRFIDNLDTQAPSAAVEKMRKNSVKHLIEAFDPNQPRKLWDMVRARAEPAAEPAGLASALPAAVPHPITEQVSQVIADEQLFG